MKRLISVLLAAVMMACASAPTVFAETSEIWNGTTDTEFAGSGTEADPYLITSAEEFAGLASKVNGGTTYSGSYFRLDSDIYLNNVLSYDSWSTTAPANSWTAIGTSTSKSFKGVFDGNDKTVYGLYISKSTTNYQGLFGVTSAGTISDLSVEKAYIVGKQYVGGVVGYAASNSTLINCDFSGSVTAAGTSSSSYCGGVAGSAASSTTMTDCDAAGTLSALGSCGGVVGYAVTALNKTMTIENCTSAMTVTGSASGVGGVIGYLKGTGSGAVANITNCKNTGSVTNTSTGTNSMRCGGVIGYADISTKNIALTVSGCSNEGAVSAGNMNVGGVVGYAAATASGATVKLTDCTNSGAVSAPTATGGILGYGYASGANSIITVEKSTNSGSITGTDSQTGGVVGYLYAYGTTSKVTASGLTNTGAVTGVSRTAGVVGDIASESGSSAASSVSGNSNSGEINATGTYIGGIVGIATSTPISASSNSGEIIGSGSDVGGITGYMTLSSIDSCYNEGNIDGDKNVGGIIGNFADGGDGSVSYGVSNCYNHGNITSGEDAGGIVGYSYGKVSNCYNLGEVYGDRTMGGIAGTAYEYTYDNCIYWVDCGAEGFAGDDRTTETNCVSLDKLQFGEQSNFAGFDFTNVWIMRTGFTAYYPILRVSGLEAVLGDGSESNPYRIETIDVLSSLSNQVTNGNNFSGKYFIVTDDLMLNDTTEWETWGTTDEISDSIIAPELPWTPIGTSSVPFAGIFDGQGHTISGLYSFWDVANRGLFGQTDGAVIKNLNLEKSYFNGSSKIGLLVGNAVNTEITDVTVSGNVVSRNAYAGVVAGYLAGESTIRRVAVSGTVEAENYVGGIAGCAEADTSIISCSSEADAAAQETYCGGIAGSSNGTVSGCYNVGSVSAPENAGEILGGGNASYANCYYKNGVNSNVGAVAGKDVAASNMVGISSGEFTTLENIWKLNLGVDGVNNGDWARGENYPEFETEENRAVCKVTFTGAYEGEVFTNEDGTVDLPTGADYQFTVGAVPFDGKDVTEDVTVNVSVATTSLTVTYVGDYVGTVTVEYGSSVVLPTIEGYDLTFTANGKAFDGTNIRNDVTVTVTKTIKTFTVTYVGDYAGSETVTYGGSVILPTMEGHDLSFTANGTVFTGEDIKADVTVTVVKTIHTFTVTYTGAYEGTEVVEYGGSVTLPTKEGYTLSFTADGAVFDGTNITSDKTVEVTEEIIMLTVTYTGEISKIDTVPYGSDATLPTMTGYTLSFTTGGKTFTGKNITADVVVFVGKSPIRLQVTFVGDYEGSTYVNYGDSVTLPSMDGYTLSFMVDGEPFSGVNITESVTVTVTATTVSLPYSVTFFTATSRLVITAPEDNTVTVVFASYDGSGRLTGVRFDNNKSISRGNNEFTVSDLEFVPTKVMLWADVESLEPLCASNTI